MMSPYRVVIVEDEPLARRWLQELLDHDPEVTVVAECSDGREAVKVITEYDPDLVLLDIHIPEIDGFGVIRAIGPDRMPAVIFVTASDAHAVRAFDMHAVDYVLKPVSQERLNEAVRRAKERLQMAPSSPNDSSVRERLTALIAEVSAVVGGGTITLPENATPALRPTSGAPAPKLAVKVDGRVVFVAPTAIDWVEAMDNYVRLHIGTEAHVIRETLTNLERRLPAGAFLRIHRSTIVNVDRIREVEPWFGGDYVVVLSDGRKLNSGRRYRGAVQAFLNRSL